MKLQLLSIEEGERRKAQWHRWFAWYPVRISPNHCAWLTTVERRGEWKWGGGCYVWAWEYREVGE